MAFLPQSAILGSLAKDVITNGNLTVMKYKATDMKDEDVKIMEDIFRKQHNDVTDVTAQQRSQILSDMQKKMFGDVPTGKEKISVKTSKSLLFSDLMTTTAGLSAEVSKHYFAGAGGAAAGRPMGGHVMVSRVKKDAFLRQYDNAYDDEERKMMLSNNSSRNAMNIDEYQNWRTMLIADHGLDLPPGVDFKRGGSAAQVEPNTQLFTFPLMVAYLRKKYSEGDLSKMMLFFNSTGDTRRKMIKWAPAEFNMRASNNNPLLVPLCGLTTAKIAGAVNLAVGGPCFTLAGLAFVAPNQEVTTLNVMHELIGLCSAPIDGNNAGFYQTVSTTVYRYLEPRMYHMNESRIKGTSYFVNDDTSMWHYDLNARTLSKKKQNGARDKSSTGKMLDSTTKKKKVTSSTSPDN